MTLAETIERDLQDRLARGPLPALTLPALARHYGVSFSPVRAALTALIDRGFLVKRDTGRLEIGRRRPQAPRRARSSATTATPSSAAWEAKLEAEIIRRSLRGDTDYLREEATAERYDVGRTSVRQAFTRLSGKGLLEHVPRCGWRVRPFSAADLSAYLEVRESLELKALELARPHLVEADLRRMLAGNAATRPGGQPRLDNQLHAYLIEKSGNRYLADFFHRHGVYYNTLFDFAAPEAQAVSAMAAQHRQILQALVDQDWARARRALAEHIRAQRPAIERLLAAMQGAGKRDQGAVG